MTIDELIDIVKKSGVVSEEDYIFGLEYAIILEGPFDYSDIRYKPRGDSKIIRLDSHKETRVNFQFSNSQMTAEKISGGNLWSKSYLIGTKAFQKSDVIYYEVQVNKINKDKTGICVGLTTSKNEAYYSSDIVVGLSGNKHGTSNLKSFSSPKCWKNDRIGVLVDMKNRQVRFYKNSHYLGIYANLDRSFLYYPVIHMFYQSDKVTMIPHQNIPKDYVYNSNGN
jgi:hypothetical protein